MSCNLEVALKIKSRIENKPIDQIKALYEEKVRSDKFKYPDSNVHAPVEVFRGYEGPDLYSYNKRPKKKKKIEFDCKFCLGKLEYIAKSTFSSLYFESEGDSILANQLYIIPNKHISNTRQVDSATREEIRNFQKTLIQLFSTRGYAIIFYENASEIPPEYMAKYGTHVKVECFPIPSNLIPLARTWFMKSMQDLAKNWQSKSFYTVEPKALDRTIPEGFAYIHVDFNLFGGFLYQCKEKVDREFVNGIFRSIFELNRFHKPYFNTNYDIVVERFRKDYQPFNWCK
ncbi:CWF19-like protein 2 homolog [Babesia microti strain RI]|uniref:CWF19-like protein 2 homolog n=1 Tax=Babesia microti (strain RI) TaxID=1133968 RepID=A0A1N6LY37_BABMR|nr:CWF19-like protein 2 homolog [Babesia microti strain RI]SIO73772.1 CWF19-like protein 2 homolog [Babesia microti strain RI]|eukprot:XP_021337834.1 CWF19-like protein 2 homolog [Babesia microti strain RI]